jgi:chemotaxis protein CheD
MNKIVLGIGDLAASASIGQLIVTHALGSCVAAVLRCKRTQAVGMVHVALPTGAGGAERKIGYYADTGVPALVDAMGKLGASPNTLDVVLVGGASVIEGLESFGIGKRNVLAVRKILWRYGLGPVAEDVGGDISRTVQVTVGVPGVLVTNPTRGSWKL